MVAAYQYDLLPSGGASLPSVEASGNPYAEMAEKRVELQKLMANADKINAAYMVLAPNYAEQMSSVAGYVPSLEDAAGQADRIIRDRLAPFEYLKDLKIIVGNIEELSPSARKATVDISFSTLSSEDGLQAIVELGKAKDGIVWENINLNTDRQRKEIALSGRVQLLMVEAAE